MNTEINIDGMIGPTHHFGGLGVGNLASLASQNSQSNPRAAALEGIAKMELVAGLGVGQYYLPPPARPNWLWLESLGFGGDRRDALRRCWDEAPSVLSAAYSSAFMWTANAATVSPSSDTLDRLVHLLPANLCCNLHRAQEAIERRDQLRAMFRHVSNVRVHDPLPSVFSLRDEGAANHMRLCGSDKNNAIHVFVYGPAETNRTRFTPRQSEFAARRAASCLRLDTTKCVFVQQSERAIDAGVFHNDVIATSHQNWLLYHEFAFEKGEQAVEAIRKAFLETTGEPIEEVRVLDSQLPLAEAVRTYLFNSQLLAVERNQMELLCPVQCMESPAVSALVPEWISNPRNPIQRAKYLPLDQSMRNGGGPACLRLRVMLNAEELGMLDGRYRATHERTEQLRKIVMNSYPESLTLADLQRLEFAEHATHISKTIAALSQ